MNDLAETVLTGILSGLAADILWDSGKWAWRNRQDIAVRLGRSPRDIVINLQPLTLRAEAQPINVTVGSERQILYNVEAPTPSLARRLEELGSWYLHVS